MIIVIVHWKIKKGQEEVFLNHWDEALKPEDTSELFQEDLSRPLTPEEADFPCGVLGLEESPDFTSFFNVGVWESPEAFQKAVLSGKPLKRLDCEYSIRERMVLAPQRSHTGEAQLP